MDRTRVYVTIDTECAEERVVRGRALPPQGYEARVWCRFRNRRDDLGVGLIARELEAYGHRGTFFVEALGAPFFGVEGLREVCTFLRGRGHDVQLHTHPIQKNAGYRTKGDEPAPDNLAAYDVESQASLLREGVANLAKAGVPREDVVALRAGNFGANADTWEAMRRAGLVLSSSYNPCYFDTGSGKGRCAMRSPKARASLFQVAEDLWELPITNFVDGSGPRHLQITAVSTGETIDAMRAARAMGAKTICVVTHSFELCHVDSVVERLGRPNTLNIHRFRELCRFLRESDRDFVVDTCGALGGGSRAARSRPIRTRRASCRRGRAPRAPSGSSSRPTNASSRASPSRREAVKP